MKLVMLGAPGSGKGSVADPLSKKLGIPCISTGDIFRQNIREKTPLGLLVDGFISKGELVPDELTNSVVEDRIKKEDCKDGFIMDGYPRTLLQAKVFDESLRRRGEKLDHVINLEVKNEIIISRIASRRVCVACGKIYNTKNNMPALHGICDTCGNNVILRDDDSDETVLKRLITYHEKTKILIDYYNEANLLINIAGQASVEEIVDIIMNSICKE